MKRTCIYSDCPGGGGQARAPFLASCELCRPRFEHEMREHAREEARLPAGRCALATEVYAAACASDLTFYGKTGGDLAYLLGAIAQGRRVPTNLPARSQLRKILRAAFSSKEHPVWEYVTFTYDKTKGY